MAPNHSTAQQHRRHKVIKDNTRLRQKLIRPGDILLTYDRGMADRAIAWSGKGIFSHAAIFFTDQHFVEAISKGTIISLFKTTHLEGGDTLSPLVKPTHMTRAALYRHEGFLSSIRKGVLADMDEGTIALPEIYGRLKGERFEKLLAQRRAEEIERIVNERAEDRVRTLALANLCRPYPSIAGVIRDIAESVPPNDPSALRTKLADIARKDSTHTILLEIQQLCAPFLERKARKADEKRRMKKEGASGEPGSEGKKGQETPIYMGPPAHPGMFCSELVANIYAGLGFPLTLASKKVPPSIIATCPELTYIDGAFIDSYPDAMPLDEARGKGLDLSVVDLTNDNDPLVKLTRSVAEMWKTRDAMLAEIAAIADAIPGILKQVSRERH